MASYWYYSPDLTTSQRNPAQGDDKRVNCDGRPGTIFRRANATDFAVHTYLNLDGQNKSFELASMGGSPTAFILLQRPDIRITADGQNNLTVTDSSGKPASLDDPDAAVTPDTAAQTDLSVRPASGQAVAPKIAPRTGGVVAPMSAQNNNFYRKYDIQPIGNGQTVLITLEANGLQFRIVAEPVQPKDGGPVTQYAMYSPGVVSLYTKSVIVLPDPNAPEGTRVEGMTVTRMVIGNDGSQQPVQNRGRHQTSSLYTTPPRRDPAFRVPLRMDNPGWGMGRPRLWLAWDGQHEIQVEPVRTRFGGLKTLVPVYNIEQWATGNLNGMKFLSNVYTEGSPAPRYFYLKKNSDDSIAIYGNDDIDKLKAIEKGEH